MIRSFTAPPTLTLWIGLASGYVVAYGISMMKEEDSGEAKRKVELMPTSKSCFVRR